MRPPSRRLAPQDRNHQAAPWRPSGGGVTGPGGDCGEPPPPTPPPPLFPPPQAHGRPEAGRRDGGPAPPRGGHCTKKGETTAAASAAARQVPPVDRPLTPALPAADRQRNGGTQECTSEAAHCGASLGKARERTVARRPLPPPPPPRRPTGGRPGRARRPGPPGSPD